LLLRQCATVIPDFRTTLKIIFSVRRFRYVNAQAARDLRSEGNTRRAIDFHAGDTINEEALKTLVRCRRGPEQIQSPKVIQRARVPTARNPKIQRVAPNAGIEPSGMRDWSFGNDRENSAARGDIPDKHAGYRIAALGSAANAP
jgi:hypothetical protein